MDSMPSLLNSSLGIVSSGTPLVLVGSPDSHASEFLRDALASWHYHVEVVEDGREAIERLKAAGCPAIALLDMDLPNASGVEIVWEVTRRMEQRRSWLVLMSRRAGKDRIRAALECGCDDFLALPVDTQDFKMRMRVAERVLALSGQVRRQTAELRYQSTHDGLTGLWNREALISLLFQETDRVQRMKTDLSLMLLDLDDFSAVNQEYGYEAGDQLLRGMATRFRRQLRSYDLIGRCGEDEFLLALPGCNHQSALSLAERIRETILGRRFVVRQEGVTLRASFGIAVSQGRSPVVVLREAERALAQAKLSGKDCTRCYLPEPLLPADDSMQRVAG